MNAAMRPPLYQYQEAFKKTVAHINRFTDEQYNEMIRMMGGVRKASILPKYNFVISTNSPSQLKSLLKDMGFTQARDYLVFSGYLKLAYPYNKTGEDQCNVDYKKIKDAIEGGVITSYGDNPLDAKNGKGENIKNLTKSTQYSNTKYEDDGTGEERRVSQGVAQNIDQLLANNEKTKSINYILGAVALVAVIVMIWVVKKNK